MKSCNKFEKSFKNLINGDVCISYTKNSQGKRTCLFFVGMYAEEKSLTKFSNDIKRLTPCGWKQLLS